ncbi:MAG: F0F1 ATP synthase subunit epsilon [Acidobacteriota bacterium]
MAEKLHLEIVTPDHLVLSEEVDEVQVPGRNGYLGILPGHAPLITELQIGEVSYRRDKTSHYLAVAWGYCEVLEDRVAILAETAEKAEDIDLNRAVAAQQRAEKRLSDQQNPDIDFDRAAVSLQRALSRIQVSQKLGAPRH